MWAFWTLIGLGVLGNCIRLYQGLNGSDQPAKKYVASDVLTSCIALALLWAAVQQVWR